MPALTRVTQKLFGSSAAAGQIGQFGSFAAGSPTTTTDPAVMQGLANFLGGWFSAIVGNNSPAIEDMNALFVLGFRQLCYIFEKGIPEWDSGTTYYIGSVVQVAGTPYVSLTDNNTNNAVTNGTHWVAFMGRTSAKTANYTVAATDDTILCNAASAAFTVTLPAASTMKGKRVHIKKIDDSPNAVTIARTGSDLIDGETSQVYIAPMTAVTWASDGTNWYGY